MARVGDPQGSPSLWGASSPIADAILGLRAGGSGVELGGL